MRRFLKLAVFTGLPFAIGMGLFFTIWFGHPTGLVLGLISGLLFGLTLALFVYLLSFRAACAEAAFEGEVLIKQGPANHLRRMEGVGGWLYLTEQRLLFRSHRFNIQNHELSIPLGDILEVQARATAWIIPNGLLVVTPQ